MADAPPSVERLTKRLEREHRARLEAEAIAEWATRAALHDSLTGLPNRSLVIDRLSLALDRAQSSAVDVALFFVDLDRFKLVNDSFGHEVGDQVLVELGARLLGAARSNDTVGRLGGDEFVVLCDEVVDRAAAVVIATRLVAAITPPIRVGNVELRVTASVGIALSRNRSDPDELIRECDTAMYHAKDSGIGRCEFFDEATRVTGLNRLQLESELRVAVENEDFELHYQPIVDATSQRIVAIEPLVRWRHPTRGLVAPLEFIPLAEEAGLIGSIDRWVLRRACEQAVVWRAYSDEPGPRLSVNLSAPQLSAPGLDEFVAQTLRDTGFPGSDLMLEITERMLVTDSVIATDNLDRIQQQGVRIAIDDFGTGYSSLAYLRRFTIDTLKIDRSFTAGLDQPGEGDDDAIVGAIIAMGTALGLSVVAEGIESAAQFERVKALGCHEVQGYLFGRPLPADEFEGAHLLDARTQVA
jgi:diguanylate cyclase (GGDEF)-like protein